MYLFGIFALAVVVVGGAGYLAVQSGMFDVVQQEQIDEAVGSSLEDLVALGTCPDTLQTSVTLTLKNDENDASDDTFDATGYLYKMVDGVEVYDQSVTDTTAGAVNLDCSQTYRLRLVSADADEGDNAKIGRIVSGTDAKILDGGEAIEFTPTGRSYALKFAGERHGVLEFRAYDNDESGFMCDSDDSCTAWETDGVTFESTTNATAKAVGAGECIDITVEFRSTKTNTSFDDFGYIVLVEGGASANTIWADPDRVAVNGVVLQDIDGTLTPEEQDLWDAYEYAYLVESQDIDRGKNTLDLEWCAESAQNPTADIEVDFASRGAYLSIDGSTVKYGGAKDDTSNTAVYTVQDITFDLS